MTDWEGFEIEGRLGVGATGTVWLARQLSLGRRVALKELAPELAGDEAVRARLHHEAETLARLDHPNCVGVYRYLESGGRAAIVMEYVEGVSLRTVIERGPLSVEQALSVLEGALLGLAYAHDRGVLHGDVKPDNILLSTSGMSKLVDFGLAAAIGTRRAPGMGSPAYSSPEAAAGSPLGVASDLYSAGQVLAGLVSGAVTAAGAAARPDGLSPVETLIRRALDPDPAARPATATAFLEDLRAAAAAECGDDWRRRAGLVPLVVAAMATVAGAGAAVGVAAATEPNRPGRVRRRGRAARAMRAHPWPAAGGAVAVVAAAVVLAVTAFHPAARRLPPSSGVSASSIATASRTSATVISATTAPSAINADAVTQLVTAFYDRYLACTLSCAASLIRQYGTTQLESYATAPAGYIFDVNPIVCAQNIPGAIRVSGVTTRASEASGTVTETFSSSSVTPTFVVVDEAGRLRIDRIACNPPVAPRPAPGAAGTATTAPAGSTAGIDGTYTINVPAAYAGCGSPPLGGDTLTVHGTTATITPGGGSSSWTGTAVTTGSIFSIHVTNGVLDNAPGSISISLTGTATPGVGLSGQSVNSGVYPGGTQGFGCTAPFTATRGGSTTAPIAPPTTSVSTAGAAAPCTQAAITAAAEAVDGSNFDGIDSGGQGFGCSGRFAYAFATVGSGSTKDDVTILFTAVNGAWQAANRAIDCPGGEVPAAIYEQACETN